MKLKVQSLEHIKGGTGKGGKPWTLVKASFEGQEGPRTGFVYENVPKVGDEIEVELFSEEYQGKMQEKFKLLTAKAAQANVSEMAIKMEVGKWSQEILRRLDLIIKHLEIKDHVAEGERVRNLEPGDIPF